MTLRIAGIGTAVPKYSISQADASEVSKWFCHAADEQLRLIPALYRRSGVSRRHSVLLEASDGDPFKRQSFYSKVTGENDRGPTTLDRMDIYEREAPPLALHAAREAVADADVDPTSITHVVTVSCTGFHAPGIDASLIEDLGLRRRVERTHVGFMGCHGALNGIRVASSFGQENPNARVLICAVELCTLHFFYGWEADKIVANSLFADGAAAVVGIGGTPSIGASDWIATGNGTLLIPDSQEAMTWKIGNHGFHMTLSPQVPQLIRENVQDWLIEWLGEHSLSIEDVATWAVHPGGPRILNAFGEAIGLDKGAMNVSREILAQFGNMSSATLLFILHRLRRAGAPRPCVAVGFGPGMVVETLLMR